jgi:hypothetical protein
MPVKKPTATRTMVNPSRAGMLNPSCGAARGTNHINNAMANTITGGGTFDSRKDILASYSIEIGIWSLRVPFTKRDNVELVVNRNQGSDDPVDSGGLVGQTDLRRRCTLNRLSTNNSSLDTLTETSAAAATVMRLFAGPRFSRQPI